MIPEDAVEAANEAAFRKFNGMMRPALVKVVLEAAAPHLTAEASTVWHDAVSKAYVDGAISALAAGALWARNPYRTPTDAV